MKATIAIPAPAKLLTLNRERTLHFMERANIVKEWRKTVFVLAKYSKLPKFENIEVVARIEQAKGKLADTGAHAPVLKACIDGLVDAGVILDDSGEYVRAIAEMPPRRGLDTVTLELFGPLRAETIPLTHDLMAYRQERETRIARQQRNCVHIKKIVGRCVECGAAC